MLVFDVYRVSASRHHHHHQLDVKRCQLMMMSARSERLADDDADARCKKMSEYLDVYTYVMMPKPYIEHVSTMTSSSSARCK